MILNKKNPYYRNDFYNICKFLQLEDICAIAMINSSLKKQAKEYISSKFSKKELKAKKNDLEKVKMDLQYFEKQAYYVPEITKEYEKVCNAIEVLNLIVKINTKKSRKIKKCHSL